MNADITSAGIYTDFQGLARLRHASKDQSPEALRAVAKQFEALFMQMMLKNMRDASLADGIFDSDQTEFYQEMFDKQISISMSERQGLGIADMIVRQLDGIRPDRTTPRSNPLDTRGKTNHEGKMESPVDFVSTLKPLAERAGKKAGLKPDVLLAQAALETGW
ncbi:MAG TPA: rod-binding protein, partial [Gammaproteobacteria bacterium]